MTCELKNLRKAILFTAVIFAGLYAKAGNDILIIDVNNVVPEIDYIQSYLKQEQAQGRELDTQLVIVPSFKRLPMETRRKLQDLHLQTIEPNSKYYQDHCSVGAMASSASLKSNCEKAIQAANSGRRAAQQLTGSNRNDGTYAIEDIETELAETIRGNYQFSRVFISGHHSPDFSKGYIAGELYAEFTSDLAKRLLNEAPSTQSARSLIMLGCWTGRPEMMENAWGKVLPQAAFHSGFVEEAPAKINPTNLMILDSILRNEKVIGTSQSEAELKQNYSNLKVADRKIAVMVRGMYISPSGVRLIR